MWSVKWVRVPATNQSAGAAPATKTATHLVKTAQKYCACHTKRLPTRYHGHNDLWASENVKVRNSEFLYETSFDNPDKH